MKYTVIASLTCRGNWNTIDSKGTWAEAWALHNKLKAENPGVTYHII